MLRGGFGDDVTAVNESPLRSGRDGIHRVLVDIPCLALLQSCLFTQHSPAWKAGGAVHREHGAQHLLTFLIQISCPPPCSTGVPGGADTTCVAPSLSSSGLSSFPCRLPLHSGGDIFVSSYTLSNHQLQLGFYHCHLRPFHSLFSAELARQWHTDFSLPCHPMKEKRNDGGGEERERILKGGSWNSKVQCLKRNKSIKKLEKSLRCLFSRVLGLANSTRSCTRAVTAMHSGITQQLPIPHIPVTPQPCLCPVAVPAGCSVTASTTPVVAPAIAAALATTSSPGSLPPPTAPTSASVSASWALPSLQALLGALGQTGCSLLGLGGLQGTAERALHSRCGCSGEARTGRSPRSMWGFGCACVPVPPVCPRVRAGKSHCSMLSAR